MKWHEIEQLIQRSQRKIRDLSLERVPGNPERRKYYRFLYYLVKWRKPACALEIGVEGGMASAYMCAAAKTYGGHVIGLDLNEPLLQEENYHFIQGDSTSQDVFSNVGEAVKAHGPIGVVFQDSSHHYEASCIEWQLYSSYLDKNAIWICDDITPAFYAEGVDPPGKGMIQYFAELPGDKQLYQNILHFGNIQGIILHA